MIVAHVIPIGDLIEHDQEGGPLCDCVCGPHVAFIEGGSVVVIHHSLDGRELEEANRDD